MEGRKGTYLEVNETNFKYNIEQIKKITDYKANIMPIIKANAYGTHINKNMDLIKEFNIVGVALVQEGVELRKIGFKNEIFILNQPLKEEIEDILDNDLKIGVASISFLKELRKYDKNVKIHLEIETGMGRTGINLEDLSEVINEITKSPRISVEGVYTHLSSAESDVEYTNKQISLFNKAVEQIKLNFKDVKYTHIFASSGILNCSIDKSNMVRPGIMIYGHKPAINNLKEIKLKPVTRLISEVSFIKEIPEETSISYGRTFVSDKKMKIATIPIGYADGIRRSLSNKGNVVINNKIANIVGTVCMDAILVDVTKIEDVKVGDKVYIWDNEKITLEDVANKCNTIVYDILASVSNRVPRKFVK